MTTSQGPTTMRRRLRAELKDLRLASGYSTEQAADDVEWSASKLARIENGQVGISVSDVEALLRLYGVKDGDARWVELRQMARGTRQRTWWSAYQRYLSSSYQEFIGEESDASRISHYHPTVIPGLLQTHDYTLAINEATGLSPMAPDVAEAKLRIRLERQRHVLERPDPPEYIAMIDEVALRRIVGRPEAMAAQLAHLIESANKPHVSVIIVPFSAGPHPGLAGPFAVMEYEHVATDNVVCLESPSGDVVVRDNATVVADYQRVGDHLKDVGIKGDEAVRFIETVAQTFR